MNSIEEITEDYMITKRNLNPLARLKKIFFPNNTFTGTDAKIETFKKSARLLQKFAFEN